VLYEGVQEPYIDLEQGRIAGLFSTTSSPTGTAWFGQPCGLRRLLATAFYAGPYDAGDSELLHAVDEALAAMEQDGELRRILTRWELWDARQALPSTHHAQARRQRYAPGDVGAAPTISARAGFTLIISPSPWCSRSTAACC